MPKELLHHGATFGRPAQIAALHITHTEALTEQIGSGSIASLATAAVDVVGALLVEVLDSFDERGGVEPVEELSPFEVSFGLFAWTAYIENHRCRVGTSSRDEGFGSEDRQFALRRTQASKTQGGSK